MALTILFVFLYCQIPLLFFLLLFLLSRNNMHLNLPHEMCIHTLESGSHFPHIGSHCKMPFVDGLLKSPSFFFWQEKKKKGRSFWFGEFLMREYVIFLGPIHLTRKMKGTAQ